VEGGDCLLMHLGMSGRFSIEKPDGRVLRPGEFYDEVGTETAGAHDHVVFHLSDGTRITYADPRRFGIMDLFPLASAARHPLLKDLGIEPLGPDLTAEFLAEAFEGRKAPLKAALLDQSVVAGLGNIYVCEALFRARLSPKRKAGTLVRKGRPDARLDSLVKEIRAVLLEAITAGGSTLRDYARTDGRQGQFQERFAVYDREGEPCPRCASAVRRIVQSNRSTFFCPNCQR
jgi:formamidopyrimidine-DNA glycosylase